MVTIKQLEALYWFAELGTIEKAARRLHTTQSAVSKRLHELESTIDIAILNREFRGIRLTEKGDELVELSRELLKIKDRMLDLKADRPTSIRRCRLGVTELTALTWLPQLVTRLKQEYPQMVLEPGVGMNRQLHEQLLEGAVDLVVMHDAYLEPFLASRTLGEVEYGWMASPSLIAGKRALSLDELCSHIHIHQGAQSWSGVFLSQWLQTRGVTFAKTMSSNNLMAAIGLTVAGVGISYLPIAGLAGLVKRRLLRHVKTELPALNVPYVVVYRNDRPSASLSRLVETIESVADFSRTILA